jgi:hypothetical protein
MSVNGVGALHVVNGMMNTAQYVHVIEEVMIPQVQEWFPNGNFIFMQDGAPCHTSKKSMQSLNNANVPVLKWPGNSPDLNVIETLWAVVKRRLRGLTLQTKQELVSAIKHVWMEDISVVETCRKLIATMPDRVQAVIKARGGNTNY